MFRKAIVENCRAQRVVKYYSSSPLDEVFLKDVEGLGEIDINQTSKTFHLDVPHAFAVEGIYGGYQFTLTLKSKEGRGAEENLDGLLGPENVADPEENIYLDYNSTTPLDPQVAAAMAPYIHQHFHNPSSPHLPGQKNRQALENARSQVADLLQAPAVTLVFTSGGTESIHSAILGVAEKARQEGNPRKKILTTSVEHSATVIALEQAKTWGFDIEYLPVDHRAIVLPEVWDEAMGDDVLLVTAIHLNNETGTIQPLDHLFSLIEKHGVLLHLDAVQSVGKWDIDLDRWPVDLLSLSGHKLYGPRGVGVLYLAEGTPWHPLIGSKSQERGRRGGTENLPAIVGLGRACHIAREEMEMDQSHLYSLRNHFLRDLEENIGSFRFNTDLDSSFPSTINLSLPHIDSDTMVNLLAEKGVFVSRGSACNSHIVEPSHVLTAMGITGDEGRNALRFSFGKYTTPYELTVATSKIVEILIQLGIPL